MVFGNGCISYCGGISEWISAVSYSDWYWHDDDDDNDDDDDD